MHINTFTHTHTNTHTERQKDHHTLTNTQNLKSYSLAQIDTDTGSITKKHINKHIN